jgi:thiol:disulfide interchange protein DsbD
MTLPKLAVQQDRASIISGEAVEFSEGEIWNLRLQGKGVFVNYTATWCITCIINERLVFKQEKFQRFLAENNIIYMVADWTNPDDEIAKSLEGLGRTALPVYAFYPPGGPTRDAVLLPEILTLERALEIISAELP